MLGNHPSIVIPQNTPYAEEMRKHEAHHTIYGPPKRPYVFEEFPKRLYIAERVTTGGVELKGFTVNDPREQANMESRGYCRSQEDALEALERAQLVAGELAAEREYEIRHGRISKKAAAEVRVAEAAHGARHLPEVPETPIRRKAGRPKNVE